MKRQNGLPRLLLALFPLLAAVVFGVVPRAVDLSRAQAAAARALEEGRYADASRELGFVLARQPWRTSLWETAGRAALAAGDAPTAVERLVRAEAAGAITAEGYLALGDARRLSGDWGAAVEAWERALAAGEDPLAVTYRLLEAHRRAGDTAAAVVDLRALSALEPDNPETHYQLGLLLAAREPEAALSALLKAAELDPELEAAVDLLAASLAPSPESDDPALTLFNAGRALASLDEWRLAAEAFRQALLLNAAYPEAWAFLGESLYHLGLDGREMLETALELDPESLPAHLLAALYYRRGGDPAQALFHLEQAAQIAPEAPAVAAETAQTYAEMGEINLALESFLRAVELAPEDPAYLHLLAAFSIYNEVQVDDVGLPAARAAVLANPDDPIALDLVGYAYYVQGDWVSGLRFLHRSLEANPAYAPARLHLGMLYLALERPEEAQAQLDLAAALAPGTPAAEQAIQILAEFLP